MGVLRFLGQRAFEGIIVILLITFMPNVPPDATFSESYTSKPTKPLEGKLALNNRLNDVEIWHKGDFLGPEAFDSYNGELYTSIHNGDIVKLTGEHITPVVKFGKSCKGVYQERICGRPLGFTFDKNGALYACDAYYGVYKVDVKTGKQLQLISVDNEIDGVKPKLPNSIAVLSNGDFFWTDSSTEFLLQDGFFDLLADGSGRFLHYDSKTKQNTVLLKNLHFANGVILSSDESFVLISETAKNRIHRYYLKGPKKGTFDIFIDALPGFTDNIQTDGQDGFLVPLVYPVDKDHPHITQVFGPFPLMRKFLSRVFGLIELGFKAVDRIYPNDFAERGIHYIGHFSSFQMLQVHYRVTVLHMSKDGEILDCLHSTNKKIRGISEAFIFKDHLYLGSPFNDYIGRISLEKAGLQHLAKKATPQSQTTAPPKQAPTTTVPPATTAKAPPKVQTETPKTPPPTAAPTTPKPATTKETPPKPRATTAAPTQASPKPKATNAPPTQTPPQPKATNAPPTQTPPKPKATNPPPTQAPPAKETSKEKVEKPTPSKPKETVPSKPPQEKQADPKKSV